ncbi:MAG TPA: thioredoxin domain-containing protein [Patescibacteria group bacterium]|nr:thioredoxin domain-containing protein [Patescibacteria group bacterium]
MDSGKMNLLKDGASPYLLRYQESPVHWMPWGTAAFDKAMALDKPVLLSIGHGLCRQSRIMAEESFANEEIAALMNQSFVCVKVDRDARPDIDMLYQKALELFGEKGGWPLTVFLSPDKLPFWGGTFFPAMPREGLPGMREVLRGVAVSWQEQRQTIRETGAALREKIKKLQEGQDGPIVTRAMLDRICLYYLSLIDEVNGGIGEAPKYPSLNIISLLWDAYLRTGSATYKSAVILSLTRMSQGGIYDHLGGGYFHCAVDAEWLVPDFAKTLGDNALFLSLLAEVFRETQNPLFAQRMRELVAWLTRDMAVNFGGDVAFASSLSGDSLTSAGQVEEGAYYIWRATEIEEALGPDAPLFREAYDVTQSGNWRGCNILNRLSQEALPDPEKEKRLNSYRKRLKPLRDQRPPPERDDRILADANGLAICGLLRASFSLDMPEFLSVAGSAFRFVTQHMMNTDGKLFRSFCGGRAAHAATLDDYANMCEAALLFYEATHNAAYLSQCEAWVEILMRDYWDHKSKGFFFTAATDLPLRTKTGEDTTMPSGNGTMVGVLMRLHLITGKANYYECAEATARAFSGHVMQRFYRLPTLLSNSDLVTHPVSLVMSGRSGMNELRSALRRVSFPKLVVLEVPEGMGSAWINAGGGKTRHPGAAAAYLCVGRTCLPPVTTAEDLKQVLLAERSRRRHEAANDG